MRPAFDIRRLGFKRWFERQLIESHVYLVTAFLCLTLVLAAFEELGSKTGTIERAGMLALILAGGALGLLSWERYRTILLRALQLSECSVCERCRAYARFSVLDSARGDVQDGEQVRGGTWLRVKCKSCGHEWTME
jgi:hypothetical protein